MPTTTAPTAISPATIAADLSRLLFEAEGALSDLRALRTEIRLERPKTPPWLTARIRSLSAAIEAAKGGA